MGGPAVDLQVLDSGAVLITADAVDADGVTTAWPAGVSAPVVSASDSTPGPSSFNVGTPVQTATGFTVLAGVVQPPPTPLHTGVTFTLTVDSGFTGQTAPIAVVTQAVDVVAGPATGFVAKLSAQ